MYFTVVYKKEALSFLKILANLCTPHRVGM